MRGREASRLGLQGWHLEHHHWNGPPKGGGEPGGWGTRLQDTYMANGAAQGEETTTQPLQLSLNPLPANDGPLDHCCGVIHVSMTLLARIKKNKKQLKM